MNAYSPLELAEVDPIIDGAIDLLRRGWCKDCFCRDRSGQPVEMGSPTVVSHCVLGAVIDTIAHLSGITDPYDIDNFAAAYETTKSESFVNLYGSLRFKGIVSVNDTAKSVDEVITALESFRPLVKEYLADGRDNYAM